MASAGLQTRMAAAASLFPSRPAPHPVDARPSAIFGRRSAGGAAEYARSNGCGTGHQARLTMNGLFHPTPTLYDSPTPKGAG